MNTNIRPRRRLFRNIVLIALGLTACAGIIYMALIALLVASLDGLGDSKCNSTNPSSIENVTGIKLPPSATNLHSICDGLNAWWAEAYFDIKPSDLAVFVNSTNVKFPLSTTGKPEKLECYPCNDLTTLKSYLYGTYSAPEWFEEIFIDTSNPAQYRVYFTLLAG